MTSKKMYLWIIIDDDEDIGDDENLDGNEV